MSGKNFPGNGFRREFFAANCELRRGCAGSRLEVASASVVDPSGWESVTLGKLASELLVSNEAQEKDVKNFINWKSLALKKEGVKDPSGGTWDLYTAELKNEKKTVVSLLKGDPNAKEDLRSFCHGFTFKKFTTAPDGTLYTLPNESAMEFVFAFYEPQAVKNARAGDILLFKNSKGDLFHSCILNKVVLDGNNFDYANTLVDTKNGRTAVSLKQPLKAG